MTPPRLSLLALLALLFCAPSAHAAKQAWDVEAVEGSYTITMKNDEPLYCGHPYLEDQISPWDQILSGTYRTSFRGIGLSGKGPYFKYNPHLRGPYSPGPIGVRFEVSSTSTETERVVDPSYVAPEPEPQPSPDDEEFLTAAGASSCVVLPERTCEGQRTIKKTPASYYAIGGHTRGRAIAVGMPILGTSSLLADCKDFDNTLHPDYERGSISPQIQMKVPVSSFKRRSLVLRFKGTRRVENDAAAHGKGSGTLEWDAAVKLRKVVIDEDCKEIRGRSGFACSL
jgi:hypothetical protein